MAEKGGLACDRDRVSHRDRCESVAGCRAPWYAPSGRAATPAKSTPPRREGRSRGLLYTITGSERFRYPRSPGWTLAATVAAGTAVALPARRAIPVPARGTTTLAAVGAAETLALAARLLPTLLGLTLLPLAALGGRQ